MKFRQPVSEERRKAKEEARQGIGRLTDEEIRGRANEAMADPAELKRLLRQILRSQRNLARRLAALKD